MDLQPRGREKLAQLIEKGVSIPNPPTVDIADDVEVTRISGNGVTIWPGCRIGGSRTVLSEGCELGAEGPVTLMDCRLGPRVALKGGYFKESVFLDGATMGSGAQVREGCLIEEQANGAHTVGLKQTILFPFVTLGSLINFCDCLMAGGTSRTDHSEVGSSYIHFNYTPDGDKATASLFGDVPRGVMLNERPIFLGGQGGAVGPVRVGYGTVVAAGSLLREDILEDGRLVATEPPAGLKREHRRHSYRNLVRVVRNNLIYLANLVALEHWYREVRRPFFSSQELGEAVYEGALEILAAAREERIRRLEAMAAKVPTDTDANREFAERSGNVCALFDCQLPAPDGTRFLEAFHRHAAETSGNYTETIRSLPPETRLLGVEWLNRIVDTLCADSGTLLGSMALFDR